MAFDLYITISGLCLLAHSKDELNVLLPHTHGSNKHIAVLGSHKRYQPQTDTDSLYVEHKLGAGLVSLEDLETDHKFSRNLTEHQIANLKGCVGPTRNPAAIHAQLILNQGGPCPLAVCENHGGAEWRFKQQEPQRLSTEIHWRIRDVQEEVDGREGLSVRITPVTGAPYDVKLRPVQGQIRMYLFHTLPDELPSSGTPPPKPIRKNDPAPHFTHYFDLYERPSTPAAGCIPLFEGDGEKDTARFHQANFVGRRYSCVLASLDEG